MRRQPTRLTMLALVALVLSAGPTRADDSRGGEQIFASKCATCHGAKGEGTQDGYEQPLMGDRNVAGLTRFISKSMPKDAPGECVGEDAEKVAAYVYNAFYSVEAQARIKPPRIELSRLTVRQYQNAVADLVGSFRSSGSLDQRRGLAAEYYKARRFRGSDLALERLDPEVRFDFGTSSPDPTKFEDHEFSIRWEGSLWAPDTGEYELIVRTEHAARLWVNERQQPLIDAWVKSGNDTEYRAAITLTGGRAYPLKLEFSKAKQGVDDSKKNNQKPATVPASIALWWKPPHRAEEVVPQRNLSPGRTGELFVVATPFPPDDRSMGYERGTAISKAWEQATTAAAIETADYITEHLGELADVRDGASDRAEQLRAFCGKLVERAFRRPLSDDERRLFVDRPFEGVDADTAVKRVVLFALKSPRFLYREIGAGVPDAYDVASRLSFGLWDSLPDKQLLEAAAASQLATAEQVARQAERMAAEPAARAKLRAFLLQWLRVDHMGELSKDAKAFPDFSPQLAADLRTSLELSLDEVIASVAADFRQLLLGETVYLNGSLAKVYGVDLPVDAPFQKIPLQTGDRAGVLTHPYLLAGFSYTATSSPIHRGVFLARSLLGRTLRPPPQAITPLPAESHPELTTRERVVMQTKSAACQRCHGLINPLGFSLESFDALGRYQQEEQGRPIDASGGYETRGGEQVQFTGAREFAKFLAESEEVQAAFVDQLFHYLVKQPIYAFDPQTRPNLRRSFVEQGFNLRKLTVAMMTASALATRTPAPEVAASPNGPPTPK